jgi:integrase
MSWPKTRKSRWQVSLPFSLALLLRDFKNQVEAQRLLLGKPLSDSDLVFAHSDGTALDPSTVTHVFARIARKARLGHLRLHGLRHSYASIMVAASVSVKAISQSMGHASIGITLDIYAHLLPGMGRAAAELFDHAPLVLSGKLTK